MSPKKLVTAEVNANGTWQKVTIVGKESEYLYKVHYRGTSDSADEWVVASQIKNVDSSIAPLTKAGAATQSNKSVVNCSYVAPIGPISNADGFSERIAKRKIYEMLISEVPKRKIGVTYLFYQSGQPYSNTVSVLPNRELMMKNASAPGGAMVYPIRTKYRTCGQLEGKTTFKIIDGNFSCYRNSKGFWECKTE